MLGVKVLYRSDGPGADQISTWEQGVSWNLWQHHDTCRLEPRFFCFVCLFVFLLWRGRRPKTHGSTGLPFSDSVWGGGALSATKLQCHGTWRSGPRVVFYAAENAHMLFPRFSCPDVFLGGSLWVGTLLQYHHTWRLVPFFACRANKRHDTAQAYLALIVFLRGGVVLCGKSLLRYHDA